MTKHEPLSSFVMLRPSTAALRHWVFRHSSFFRTVVLHHTDIVIHASPFLPRRLLCLGEKRPELFDEIARVGKLAVDARESHECHFIEVTEVVHH